MSSPNPHSLSVEVRDSPLLWILMLVVCVVLVSTSTLLWGWGPFGFAIFGGYGLWALARLLTRRTRLRITEDGIVDEIFWYSPGLIPWEEIIDARPTRWGLIEIDLINGQAFWDRLPLHKQFARYKTQLYGFGPAVMTPWFLESSRGELVEAMQAGLDAYALCEAARLRRLEAGGGAALAPPETP